MFYFRCATRADTQVGQPMADTKAIQKEAQNLKRMQSAVQLMWGS